jgi:hypothetical protein
VAVGDDRQLRGLRVTEIFRQVEPRHRRDVVQRRQALHHSGEEVRRGGAAGAVRARTGIPHRHLVDLDRLDRFHLERDDLLELFGEQQRRRRARVVARAVHQRLVTLRLGLEHLADALRLGFVLEQDGVRLALCFAPGLFGRGIGRDRDLLLLDLLSHHFFRGEALQLGAGLRLLDLGLRVELRHLAALRGLRGLH